MTETRDNANNALEQLRELIITTHLARNDRLPTERDLAQSLGVSRRAVRQALEVLEAEGSIWRRQGAGTFIGAGPDPDLTGSEAILEGVDILKIIEVRLRMEPQLAQLAALRATSHDIERMRDMNERIRQTAAADADARELWDGALHRLVAQSAGNALFLTLFDMVNQVRKNDIWQTVRETTRTDPDMSVAYAQHNAIIDAIAARDVSGAGEAMLKHLLAIQENLIRHSTTASVVLPVTP